MIYQPVPISEGVPPYAIALVERGRNGRLAVYAGAGMSMSEPTGLPSGADVARKLYERLKGAFPSIEGCDPSDLTAVADAVAAQSGGDEALRQTAPRVAEFTSATPCYGHRVLALLLLEGVVDVLTTNWDDCVERSGGRERVASVVSERDLLNIPTKSVLKIHGCATQPASLLLTTSDLDSPPDWVREQTSARLGTSVVVFVGIGDVAGYVKRRLEEAIATLGDVDNARIVSPGILDDWNSSPWSAMLPGLRTEHRIPASADSFLGRLGAAYVHVVLADLMDALSGDARLGGATTAASDAIAKHDPLRVLLWARGSAVVAMPGVAVLGTETMNLAIVALGVLLAGGFQISDDGLIVSDDRQFEVLAAVGIQSASRLRREADNRLAQHMNRGADAPTFLVAGGIGWSGDGDAIDILAQGGSDDLIDGPLNAKPSILRAEEVV